MATLTNEQIANTAPQQNLTGLTERDILERRRQYGENRLPAEKGTSAWTILLAQFKSPLVYIILVAAGVSLIVGEIGKAVNMYIQRHRLNVQG